MMVMVSIALSVVFTSCDKDDDGSSSITMTKTNVVGTWENSAKNITLVISATGTGSYTSDYYSDSESITWGIANEKHLEISGTGLFCQTYKLKSATQLEDIFMGTVLTKK